MLHKNLDNRLFHKSAGFDKPTSTHQVFTSHLIRFQDPHQSSLIGLALPNNPPLIANNSLIAIVDDDESVREAIKGLLRSMKFTAETFSSAEDFLRSAHVNRTTCLIADINMPGMSGFDLYRHISNLSRRIPMILITAYPNDGVRASPPGAGIFGYLIKPFSDDDLLKSLRFAFSAAPDRDDAP
ncbi:response regulator transcription factor [Acidocella sp.]|uniref:response regulator transcription factor n=1 Tax=Acidocella sp. TaxID=50710 RepID=UPI002F3F2B0B